MTDPPAYPDSNGDTGMRPEGGSTTGTPRWVKVSGIIALALVLLFVTLMLTGRGGGHGPGRHTSSVHPGGDTPPSGITERGLQQP